MDIDLEQAIRERAYGLWEREGRIDGRHEEHWHAAKLELAAAPEATSIVVPAANSTAPTKKSRRRATPAEPTSPVTAAAPARRRTPARPAR